MAASNTKDAVRELIGRRIVGVLFDTLPLGRADLNSGTKTLVFDDGSGFTFTAHGTFWQESQQEIARAVSVAQKQLSDVQREVEGVLSLAGALRAGVPREQNEDAETRVGHPDVGDGARTAASNEAICADLLTALTLAGEFIVNAPLNPWWDSQAAWLLPQIEAAIAKAKSR